MSSLPEHKHPEPEVWKDIPEYEGLYQVSSYGRIRSVLRKVNRGDAFFVLRKGRILSTFNHSLGYIKVSLSKNNKIKTYMVHRLVALAFVSGYSLKMKVNHKDEDKSNNYFNNLEWVTVRENSSYSIDKTKTSSQYTGVHFSKSCKSKPWIALIAVDSNQKYLGKFSTEEEASQAYKSALKEKGLKNKYAT